MVTFHIWEALLYTIVLLSCGYLLGFYITAARTSKIIAHMSDEEIKVLAELVAKERGER